MNLPGDTDRLTIVGATGSGKTQAGMWHLSQRPLDQQIWIVYDFKRDDLINEIELAEHINLQDKLPERPGLYIAHPVPGSEGAVDDHMWRIWQRENIGLYIDEGYMIGQNSAPFRALLTQGRSKHIPMITLSQRPVYMDRFAFSESEYFQVFRLQHNDDIKNAQKFIPRDISKRLDRYHSYYYDVVNDRLAVVTPVPDRQAILDTFETKLHRFRKVI